MARMPTSNSNIASSDGHGDADVRRILAPARALAELGNTPSRAEMEWSRARAQALETADPGVLYEELTALLMGRSTREALQWLRDADLLVRVLPELDATVAFSQEGGRRHKDVWDHTKVVVWQSVPKVEVRWAALLHDIGKVPTRRYLEDGRVTFHGHAEVGVRMFRRGPARRIRFPKSVRRRIEDLIRFHLRPGQYESSWTDSALRRFDRDVGDAMTDLLNLSRADVTSRRPGKRRRCLYSISALARRLRDLRVEDAKRPLLPAGLGQTLMEGLQLPPGPHIGVLRNKMQALCEAGQIEGDREAAYYLGVVRERRLMADVQTIAARRARGRTPENSD